MGSGRPTVTAAAAFAVAATLLLAGCAGTRVEPPVTADGPSVRSFAFVTDTFTFPNQIRARHRGEPGLYANYCFVLARALRQFHMYARFDPAAPSVDRATYVERVRAVVRRPPWTGPVRDSDRITIPGYANLREFSAAQEQAVKEGLGGRFWTWVHWTNWRVTFPVTGDQQAGVARDIVEDLAAGRLVQLLVTNWPKPELNHTVVVYAARRTTAGVKMTVWDPNDPFSPGVITFDAAARRFFADRLYDTEPGPIRAFRMYHSRFL